MFQVIRKQQRVIREQSKVIQTLGGKYEGFNGIEFVNGLNKLKKEKNKHVEEQEKDEGRTTTSLHDSALDESGEDTSQRTGNTEKISDNQDLSDISNYDENSDSYVTMSDASFTDSDEEEDDQTKEEELQKSGSYGINPLFEQTSLNDPDLEKTEISSPNSMEDPLSQQIATNTEKATMDKPEIARLKQIGDPEKMENHRKVKQGGESKSVLQRSVRIFRKPRVEHQARLLKSKSEGNLNELLETEPKPSFFQSIYRGLMTRSKKQDVDLKRRPFYQSTPCLVSTGSDIEMTELTKAATLQGQSYNQEDQLQSFPLFHESRGESLHTNLFQQPLFSKPIMPNHKTVQRPRVGPAMGMSIFSAS
jgi:hypothetical protein